MDGTTIPADDKFSDGSNDHLADLPDVVSPAEESDWPPSGRNQRKDTLSKMTRTAHEEGWDDTVDGFIDTR